MRMIDHVDKWLLTLRPFLQVKQQSLSNRSTQERFRIPRMSSSHLSKGTCLLLGVDVIRTGPPFNSPAWKEAATASQDACKFAPKAIAGRNLMYLFRTSAWPDSPRGDLFKSTYVEPLFAICIHVSSIAVLTFSPVEVYILYLGCRRLLRAIMHLHVIRHAGQTALLIDRREKVERRSNCYLGQCSIRNRSQCQVLSHDKGSNRFGG